MQQLLGQPVTVLGPSNIMEDHEEEYEVNYIVDSQYKGCRVEFSFTRRVGLTLIRPGSLLPTWAML